MLFISKLKSLIPPIIKYKKNYWFAKIEDVKLPKNNRVFIFLAANYGNLGDIAITYAQHKLLCNKYPDYCVVEIPSNCTYSYLKGVIRQIQSDDIVTFVGGGNMGDMYPLYENIRQIVVSRLPHNCIIQFPLTADFSKSHDGKLMELSAKKIYGRHTNIQFLSREQNTSIYLKNLLSKDVPIVPDVVLTMNCFKKNAERKGITICLRKDKEKSLADKDFNDITNKLRATSEILEFTDTVLKDDLITLNNKESFLFDFLQKISQKRLIITDRLHGMIFAYITGTPAIVFSNSNNKVKHCFEWIKDCGYIHYVDKYNEKEFEYLLEKTKEDNPDETTFLMKNKIFSNLIMDSLWSV